MNPHDVSGKEMRVENSDRLQRIVSVFQPGEMLLWSGTPSTAFRLLPNANVNVPFGIVFGVGVLFWDVHLANSHATFSALAGGVLYTLLAMYLTFGIYLQNMYSRGRTTYAVSTLAAYFRTDGLISQTRFIPAQQFAPIELQMEAGTSGTISFGPRMMPGSRARLGFALPGTRPISAQFAGIADAARVRDIMQHLADTVPDDFVADGARNIVPPAG